MTRGTTIALTFLGVLGLGLLVVGVASAADEPGPRPKPKDPFPVPFPDPTLGEDDPDGPIIFVDPFFPPVGPIKAEPVEPVEPSKPAVLSTKIPITPNGNLSGECALDGGPYDEGQWPGPTVVAGALRTLGYDVSDELTTTADRKEIKRFQARARSMKLQGMGDSPTTYVDGVVGVCTLRALTAAAVMYNGGGWPGA